jgi:hypothetical protein
VRTFVIVIVLLSVISALVGMFRLILRKDSIEDRKLSYAEASVYLLFSIFLLLLPRLLHFVFSNQW